MRSQRQRRQTQAAANAGRLARTSPEAREFEEKEPGPIEKALGAVKSRIRPAPEEEEEPGVISGAALPIHVSNDMFRDIQKYLVDEEGFDHRDADELWVETMIMAHELTQLTAEESMDSSDKAIVEAAVRAASPFANVQRKAEEADEGAGEAAAAGRAHDATDSSEAVQGPAIEEAAVPDSVDIESLEQFLAWESLTTAKDDGDTGSVLTKDLSGGGSAALAPATLGIKGWLLGKRMHPQLQALAANIECFWRELFPEDLAMADLDPRWRVVDSLDSNQGGDLEYHVTDPQPGEPGYPRLVLENRAYQTRQFRSLHMELGWRQDGFQVLHIVMWPRREFDLPILGIDAVASNGRVQFFIADASPVSADRSLPPLLSDAVAMLSATYTASLARATVPDWGQRIFSDDVLMIRPQLPTDVELSSMYAVALTRAHLLYAKRCAALDPHEDAARLNEIDAAHRRYCEEQRSNSKTTAVLRKAFEQLDDAADTLVTRYMHEVLFDHEFEYDVDPEFKAQLRKSRAGLGDVAVDAAMRDMAPALAEAIAQAAAGPNGAGAAGARAPADDGSRPGGRRSSESNADAPGGGSGGLS